jgi:hypothetical protein
MPLLLAAAIRDLWSTQFPGYPSPSTPWHNSDTLYGVVRTYYYTGNATEFYPVLKEDCSRWDVERSAACQGMVFYWDLAVHSTYTAPPHAYTYFIMALGGTLTMATYIVTLTAGAGAWLWLSVAVLIRWYRYVIANTSTPVFYTPSVIRAILWQPVGIALTLSAWLFLAHSAIYSVKGHWSPDLHHSFKLAAVSLSQTPALAMLCWSQSRHQPAVSPEEYHPVPDWARGDLGSVGKQLLECGRACAAYCVEAVRSINARPINVHVVVNSDTGASSTTINDSNDASDATALIHRRPGRAVGADIAALKELAELRASGVLSDAEFVAMKQRITGVVATHPSSVTSSNEKV